MKVLVTGAAGFIGGHLVDRLLGEGHTVVGTDNLSRGTMASLAEAVDHPGFRFVRADLGAIDADIAAVVAEGPFDRVWHLAANSDIGAGVADDAIDLRDTFLTTRSALRIARETGARGLVLASTSAVYGESDEVLDEAFGPLLPISNYGAMKLAAEAAVSAAAETFLETAWILRFPNVVGSRASHGVIRDLSIKLTHDRSRLPVLGDGSQKKPYVHVAELIDAMQFIVGQDATGRQLYNIGPEDDGVTVADLVADLVAAVGADTRIEFAGGDRGWVGDVPRFRYSVAKLRALGWRPALSSREAVGRAIDAAVREWGLLGSSS